MNILHVALGLPPLRTGGLTRYCSELMEAQAAAGDRVSLVFPGRFLPGGIRFRKGEWRGIETYELINPLPVALTFGVAEADAFVLPCRNADVFERLFGNILPDVIHVHSFMGIYREFFEAAKRLGIPMVFTTHDYYPMCPRCTFVASDGGFCNGGPDAEACAVCCRGGMTRGKSLVMQSGIYAALKASGLLKKVSSAVKSGMSSEGGAPSGAPGKEEVDAYERLLDYNKSLFSLFDLILANSEMARRAYGSVFPDANFRIARISHAGLEVDSEARKAAGHGDVLVLGYFGGRKEYKGYGTLMAAATLLHDEGVAFELRLFGDEYGDLDVPEARSFGCIAPDHVRGILRELDAVIVPSIYHETFGFVVLEALCEGVPVVCSDAVGASDLVLPEAVFPAGDAGALAKRIKALDHGAIGDQGIPDGYPLSMKQQVAEMNGCYLAAMEVAHHG